MGAGFIAGDCEKNEPYNDNREYLMKTVERLSYFLARLKILREESHMGVIDIFKLMARLVMKQVRVNIMNMLKFCFSPLRILTRYFLDYRLGSFSRDRRLGKMPGSLTFNLKRIDLKGKNVLTVVAHCDDEIIWCNTVLTAPEPLSKHILVVHEGGRGRNQSIERVADLSKSTLYHLKIPEELPMDRSTATAIIKEDAIKKIKQTLNEILESKEIDVVFTHNQFGEYGNGHHRAVHDIVRTTVSNFNKSIRVYYFGYNHASIYDSGKTRWAKTLSAFSNISPWSPFSDRDAEPFSGIFKFKKYNRYWYIENNCYIPQLNEELRKGLERSYEDVVDGWVGWLRKSSPLYKYLSSRVQYFYDEENSKNRYAEYEFPHIRLPPPNPNRRLSNINPLDRNNDIRDFLDSYLIDYLKFEGRVLWIGWDEFCVKSKYNKKVLKYANQMDKLDNKPIRTDESIYGDQVADIIADVCNLKGVISDNVYDNIYFNGVLEYVDDMQAAISECLRILKPGGRLLVGTPGYDWEMTGHNRPEFEEVIRMIRASGGIPIEVWRKYNPDYYYIHNFKDD